jgi:hypothetical protein
MLLNNRPIHILILGFAFCFFLRAAHAQKVETSKPQEDSAGHANDRGLLLGVYFPNDPNVRWNNLGAETWFLDLSSEPQGQYLTFWISRVDKTVNIQAVKGLLVPRPKGFWHAGILFVRAPNNAIAGAETWAVPVETEPPPDKVDPQASAMIAARRFITYVGSQYLTYVEPSSNGGTLDDVGHGTVGLDDPTQDLSVESVLGPASTAEYRRHAKAVANASSKEDFCSCCWGRPEEWGLVHVNVSWQAYTIFRYSGSNACSQQSEEYWIKAPVPKSLATGGILNKSWDDLRVQAATILKDDPSVFDHFFVSPKQDLVVALTDNGIVVFSADGAQTKSVLRIERFQSPCIPVMEEWAMGKHVGGWQEVVSKERATSPPARPGP